MTTLNHHLARFSRRVRVVRAWKGFAIGAAIGSSLALIWSGLDWFGLFYSEWSWLALTVAACGLLGAVIGLFWKVDSDALADSIDRRGSLANRIGTALEREANRSPFDAPLHEDADQRLAGLKSTKLYPLRLSRWHAIALVLAGLSATLFLLGNTPVLLNDQQKAERKELKESGKAVEHILKPLEKQEGEKTAEEKRLAQELRQFAKELEKARLNKEQALQKVNELADKADKLAQERAQRSEDQLSKAESAWQKLEKAELSKAGLENMDPKLADMSPEERKANIDQTQKELAQAQKELSEKSDSMTSEQRSALDSKISSLQKRLQAFKLSENVKQMLERMRNNPLFKELQEMAAKLKQETKAQQAQQRKLSDEELKALEKRLEELAEQLKDDEAMKKYLEALKKALEECKGGGQCQGMCLGLGLLPSSPGNGGRSRDLFFSNTEHINKLDKEAAGQGSTKSTVVSGERQDRGDETYIEIKGPAKLGGRSAVPYQKVLPSYKKRAEEALRRQEIPKEHEKRVREYFEGLSK
jgi:chemotaxis protein histidine kinase CheA